MTYRVEAKAATLGLSKKHCYACATILDVRADIDALVLFGMSDVDFARKYPG